MVVGREALSLPLLDLADGPLGIDAFAQEDRVRLARPPPLPLAAAGSDSLLSPRDGEQSFVEGRREPEGPPPGPPDVAKLRELASRFGSKIVGPPLAPEAR